MSTDRELLEKAAKAAPACPSCSDFDEDCADIENKVHCYVYAPERGMCPYLRAAEAIGERMP